MTKKLDPEIKALRAVHRALKPLDLDAEERVAIWATARSEDRRRTRELRK